MTEMDDLIGQGKRNWPEVFSTQVPDTSIRKCEQWISFIKADNWEVREIKQENPFRGLLRP
jgi:hypothetical protein